MAEKLNCIADESSDCEDCDLKGELICKFELKFAHKFMAGNTLYRILAVIVFIFAGLITQQWWMGISYVALTLLTFFLIEPRLLCSHCPQYEIDGKFLKCWALRGMPKLWKYRPYPINKTERTIMLIIGSIIDLAPYLGFIYGLIVFIMHPMNYLFAGIGLIIITIIFTGMVGYFSKFLIGYTCKHCANFSCAMNKVSSEVKEKYFEKNPNLKAKYEEK